LGVFRRNAAGQARSFHDIGAVHPRFMAQVTKILHDAPTRPPIAMKWKADRYFVRFSR
jgi:hypothetical protein